MSSYSQVAKGLWQGSFPDSGVDPRKFEVLVLAAKELQPRGRFPGVEVIHVPMDDSGLPMLDEERRGALAAARIVARAMREGKCVLSTCAAGLNRSGLVSALALRMLGMDPDRAIAMVRRARGPHALSNPYFVAMIEHAPLRAQR